jgi:ABC-type uncharacterized transport system substrate-binding protein
MNAALRLAVCILLLFLGGASAHPHVWVIMKCKVIFDASGSVVALQHSWSFDEMTSAFAIQGVKSREGALTREDLASHAMEQIASLRKVGYFTTVLIGNAQREFNTVSDYWLEFDGKLLTLHFALPLTIALTPKSLTIEVYDPSYFVDLRFAEESPIELILAPGGCKFSIVHQNWSNTVNKILLTCDGT